MQCFIDNNLHHQLPCHQTNLPCGWLAPFDNHERYKRSHSSPTRQTESLTFFVLCDVCTWKIELLQKPMKLSAMLSSLLQSFLVWSLAGIKYLYANRKEKWKIITERDHQQAASLGIIRGITAVVFIFSIHAAVSNWRIWNRKPKLDGGKTIRYQQ